MVIPRLNLQVRLEKAITTVLILYFFIGIVFTIIYALFYHWSALSFFSPGFYTVVISWPLQVKGFISDFSYYGFSGKVLE